MGAYTGADAPALTTGQISAFVKAAATDSVHGVRHMIQEVGKGRIAPTILAGLRRRPTPPG